MSRLNPGASGLLIVLLGLNGPPLLADEATHDAAVDDVIRVTAHPLSEIDEHIIAPVQVLSREELKTRSVRNLGETIANEPGVASSDYGTGVGRPVIRGLGGSRVKTLENGLSTMDVAAIGGDHPVATESVAVQQVEIFRGPATLLYGSGASGGIVNIVNGRILDYVPDNPEAEVSLQYETASDGMTGAGSLNFGAGNFAFHIDGLARNTGDYNIPGFGELEPEDDATRGVLENSSIDTENIAGGLSWVGQRGFMGFSVSRYENNFGIPGHHHHHHEDGHGHGHVHDMMADMDLDDDHDHDDEDEHHDDEDMDHHDDEDEHHDDEDMDHHDDEDEHHDDEDMDHHDDEDEHHDDEDMDHHDDEDEHHDDEDMDHHDDEDEHHDDEDMDHHDDEDEHHDDEDMDHHDDEDEHHDDEDMDHHDDEDEHHDDEDMDHHDDEDEHHDDDDDHGHDDEDEHHDDDDDHGHDDEDEHHDDDDDHGHDDEDEHHDDDDDHGHGDEDEHDDEEEGRVRSDMRQTRYDFMAGLDDPLPGLRRINLRWGYNDYKHDEVEANGEIGTTFDNDEVEGRVELLHDAIGRWNGVVGLHYRHQDFAAAGAESFVLPSELESIGVFVLEKTDIGPVHLDIGARFEHQSSNSDAGDKNDYDLFSASGGANWDYASGYQLGLSVGHSQRAPSIEELYALGPHLATGTFEVGDTALSREKSNNIDIYWRKTTGKFTFTANFFYNRIDGFIYQQEQDLNGDGFADRVAENFDGNPANILDPEDEDEPLLVYVTQQDAEFLGFEAETRTRLMDSDQGRMVLRLWGDYVEGERTNGINLPRITPWRFGAGLSYSRGAMSASVDYVRVNEQDSTAPLETSTNGYHLLNLHADYTFDLGQNTVSLFARASNLLDEEIRRHISFVKDEAPLPGRSGIFGMRISY